MCVGPLAALSPITALATGKKSALPLLSPALAIGMALSKKKKSAPVQTSATNAAGPPTFGPAPSYGGG